MVSGAQQRFEVVAKYLYRDVPARRPAFVEPHLDRLRELIIVARSSRAAAAICSTRASLEVRIRPFLSAGFRIIKVSEAFGGMDRLRSPLCPSSKTQRDLRQYTEFLLEVELHAWAWVRLVLDPQRMHRDIFSSSVGMNS